MKKSTIAIFAILVVCGGASMVLVSSTNLSSVPKKYELPSDELPSDEAYLPPFWNPHTTVDEYIEAAEKAGFTNIEKISYEEKTDYKSDADKVDALFVDSNSMKDRKSFTFISSKTITEKKDTHLIIRYYEWKNPLHNNNNGYDDSGE